MHFHFYKPESFGRIVLEALSVGIPVIGYDIGGVAEISINCFHKVNSKTRYKKCSFSNQEMG